MLVRHGRVILLPKQPTDMTNRANLDKESRLIRASEIEAVYLGESDQAVLNMPWISQIY